MIRARILIWLFTLGLFLVVPDATASARQETKAPPGYYLGASTVVPDSVDLQSGAFRVSIRRRASSDFERRLLADVERLFPDTAAINRAAARVTSQYSAVRLREAVLAPGERWWWESVDLVWSPFAVTGAVDDYYYRKMLERGTQQNQFGSEPHSGVFQYDISVTRSPIPEAAYVLRSHLNYHYRCGMLRAVGFSHGRAVYVRADGSILRVEGDGPPNVMMS